MPGGRPSRTRSRRPSDASEEDLEPQIEALAAEVEMSCDIRDLIEEGG